MAHVRTALNERIERGEEVELGGDEHEVLVTVEEFVEPVLRSATHPLVFKSRVVGSDMSLPAYSESFGRCGREPSHNGRIRRVPPE